MVEFIPLRKFQCDEVMPASKTNKSSSSDNVTMTACEYSMSDDILYLGLSNGKIYYYKSKNIDSNKTIFAKGGKDPDVKEEPVEH